MQETITRKEFLKKGTVGLLGLLVLLKEPIKAEAAVVNDNLGAGGGGVHVGTSAPASTNKLWVDTSKSGRGTLKYWTGSAWSATASVWDS